MTKGKGRNPGMGNLDKHIKRKVHKERSQPAARKHLGPLEKHKDHVVRSRRRKAKVQRLLELKRAAAQRNPDEFHINMTKTVLDVESGKMRRRRLSKEDNRKKMEKTLRHNTRNLHYLKYKAHADWSRAKELIEEDALGALTAAPPKNKHIIFAEDEDEYHHFNPLKQLDATPEMLKQHPAVRGRLSVLRETVLPEEILLSGYRMLSTAQKRKERREIQRKLQKSGLKSEEERAEFVKRLHAKKEVKMHRFSSLVANALESTDAEAEGEDADDPCDVDRLLEYKKIKEKEEALLAASRVKEIQQRVHRSKKLDTLARAIKKQNDGIRCSLENKRNARFKPNTKRRAR